MTCIAHEPWGNEAADKEANKMRGPQQADLTGRKPGLRPKKRAAKDKVMRMGDNYCVVDTSGSCSTDITCRICALVTEQQTRRKCPHHDANNHIQNTPRLLRAHDWRQDARAISKAKEKDKARRDSPNPEGQL